MSHIIKSKEDLKRISDNLENLRKNGYNKDVLESILESIVPNNEKFQIKIIINENDDPAFFIPSYNIIHIAPDSLKDYINKLIKPIIEVFPNINQDELFRFYVMFVLVHEVEHVYQYLIGNNFIEFPYQLIIESYNNLISSNNFNPISRRLFANKINKKYLIFERNANVEAYDLLLQTADYENNLKLKEFFKTQKLHYLKLGYTGLYNGAMEQTYNEILLGSLYKSFLKDEYIPVEDKIRYGLGVDKKTRKKILEYKFK